MPAGSELGRPLSHPTRVASKGVYTGAGAIIQTGHKDKARIFLPYTTQRFN